jgi:predicted GIY-YIG superfamily endonuclease
MTYVYILQSAAFTDKFYVGVTQDLKLRLQSHNTGAVAHTAKFRPWVIKNYFAFHDHEKACAFERYLKSGSGRAFAKRHF